jgi:DMSO/TMAO reductase YedYZ molybdopterin-dependent catalytic subunit
MNAYPLNLETPLELLNDYLTPNDLFFVRSHWNPTVVDAAKWKLQIDGEVANPLQLSLEELKRMPKHEVTCVLQCAGNGRAFTNPVVPGVQWRYGAVGNAKWGGVRVRDLLERARVKKSALHVHTFGADDPPGKVPPFHRSSETEKLMADAIVAYEMNDAPLPHLHGAPARLVVPGWAGDHWMKWLTRLSPQPKAQSGFFVETAYRYPLLPGVAGTAVKPDQMRPVTDLFVKSNITEAPKKLRVGEATVIRGFAFSGAPDVAKVEISEDDGRSWTAAELDSRHDAFAWRLWSHRWTPRTPGTVRLMVRATDARGVVQPRTPQWNQSGYLNNGWHTVEIEVLR